MAVERESEELAVGDPELIVEPSLELVRLPIKFRSPNGVLPDVSRKARGAPLGVIGLPLQFACRPRGVGQSSVREGD